MRLCSRRRKVRRQSCLSNESTQISRTYRGERVLAPLFCLLPAAFAASRRCVGRGTNLLQIYYIFVQIFIQVCAIMKGVKGYTGSCIRRTSSADGIATEWRERGMDERTV